MRLLAVSSLAMIAATCAVTSAAPPADVAPTADAAPADLPAYMEQLSAVLERCREAATLADEGRPDEAIALLHDADGIRTAGPWAGWQRGCADKLQELRGRLSAARRRPDDWHRDALWFIGMGRPDVAAQILDKRRQQAGGDESGAIRDALWIAKCWADAGRYAKARAVLEAVPSDPQAPGWPETLRLRLQSLADLRDDQPLTLALFRRLRDGSSTPPSTPGLSDIVRLWSVPAATEAEHAEKAHLLAAMFEKAGPDHVGARLALTWLAERPAAAAPDAADALLVLANKAYAARRYDEAAELWRRVERDWPNTPAWGKAAFNLGVNLQRQRKYDEAAAQFGRVLAGNVDDEEAGANIMETYRNYRPRAQWEIAQCLLAKGDAAGALAAFLTVRQKYPFQSWCGNEVQAFAYRLAFYEALCLERLGRHAEAVENYYRAAVTLTFAGGPAAALRLVELYAASGQLADLRCALDAEDARHAQAVAPQVAASKERAARTGGLIRQTDVDVQTLPLRELLALQYLEVAEDWAALAARVTTGGSAGGAVQRQDRDGNHLAAEAARLLARHPEQAVPHLAKRLGSDGGVHDRWIWYALGLCGTPKAVALLEAQAESDAVREFWGSATLAHALRLAGDPGRAALDELLARAKQEGDRGRLRYLPSAVERLLAGELGDGDAPAFPAIPEPLRLPTDPRPEGAELEGAVGTAMAPATAADAGNPAGSSQYRIGVAAATAVLGLGTLSFWRTWRRRHQ